MNHYTGNITPGKDIIFVFGKRFMVAYRNQPDQKTLCGYTGAQMMNGFFSAGDIPDNIWFSEEWYKEISRTTVERSSVKTK